ncbi:glycosyltransferase family 4 protein [Methylocucumis oryzae]|uniref:glycosyltransferase family 4 protein n=1 Tax=Methylocucumis oryzae TaxID=1632867 RepID=UPI0006982E97|nr:glycosyltransferase family 4 protein [Methylocucumis oryzae]
MPIDPTSNIITCVARLNEQKGHGVLLDGFEKAVKSGVDARLVLCGDGELRYALEKIIKEKQLENYVEITGWIDETEVRRRLQQSRALVLPSFAEGLPVVIMEAFALGRPVISTKIAGIPELVQHGVNGWLITAGRSDQLADAISEVMSTPISTLEAMANLGREAVLQHHNTFIEGQKLEQLFLSVIGD